MIYNLKIVKIDKYYCNYLRQYDKRVSYNYGNKENRPYVGILFVINNLEYFAPLSSPKSKHLKMRNTIDFFKLDSGVLGAINFNNMIPVTNNNYTLIDFSKDNKTKNEIRYLILLENQLNYLNKYYSSVIDKSSKLYNLYINNRLPKSIRHRCCNYPLLEEKCIEYNKDKILQEVW